MAKQSAYVWHIQSFLIRNFTSGDLNLSAGRWWTLVTCCISQSDPIHLAMNMISFLFMAPPVLSLVGPVTFTGLYFGAGIFSSAISIAWKKYLNPWIDRGPKDSEGRPRLVYNFSHGASGEIMLRTSQSSCKAQDNFPSSSRLRLCCYVDICLSNAPVSFLPFRLFHSPMRIILIILASLRATFLLFFVSCHNRQATGATRDYFSDVIVSCSSRSCPCPLGSLSQASSAGISTRPGSIQLGTSTRQATSAVLWRGCSFGVFV